MALDALDPGLDWSFPNVPRDPDGYLDEQLMPVGPRRHEGINGTVVILDLTPTVRDQSGNLRPITDFVTRRPRPAP